MVTEVEGELGVLLEVIGGVVGELIVAGGLFVEAPGLTSGSALAEAPSAGTARGASVLSVALEVHARGAPKAIPASKKRARETQGERIAAVIGM
jgi:hypothetical protein